MRTHRWIFGLLLLSTGCSDGARTRAEPTPAAESAEDVAAACARIAEHVWQAGATAREIMTSAGTEVIDAEPWSEATGDFVEACRQLRPIERQCLDGDDPLALAAGCSQRFDRGVSEEPIARALGALPAMWVTRPGREVLGNPVDMPASKLEAWAVGRWEDADGNGLTIRDGLSIGIDGEPSSARRLVVDGEHLQLHDELRDVSFTFVPSGADVVYRGATILDPSATASDFAFHYDVAAIEAPPPPGAPTDGVFVARRNDGPCVVAWPHGQHADAECRAEPNDTGEMTLRIDVPLTFGGPLHEVGIVLAGGRALASADAQSLRRVSR